MKILIADDEAPARNRLNDLLDEIDGPYQVVANAATGIEALEQCRVREVDLILMDIHMPEMDGLQAALQLAQREVPPAVIFITAYEEHALAAFESNAVDYLLKPIRRMRLQQALRRADSLTRPQLHLIQKLQQRSSEYIYVNYLGGMRRISLDDVIFFRAHHKYVTLCHLGGEMVLEEALKSLEQQYADRFLRIHRSTIVNKARLLGIEKGAQGRVTVVLADSDQRLEISRRHQAEVRRWLKNKRSIALSRINCEP